MATSDTRQGPGWWMDADGRWKPPELWPEASPPLPGWVRSSNGRWSAPKEVTPAPIADPSALKLSVSQTDPVIDLRDGSKGNNFGSRPARVAPNLGFQNEPTESPAVGQSAPGLGFADEQSMPIVTVPELSSPRRKAKLAAIGAAIGALIALLLIVLLLL